MILDLIFGMFASIALGLLDAIPVIPVPAWITQLAGFASTIFGFAHSMGVWFPVGLIVTVGTALLAIALASFGIRVVRILISHLTGGGGAS